MALQRASRARLYKLPLAAAVQPRRSDLIECGDLPALALPRDKLAVATSRRRGRDRAHGAETEGAETVRIFNTIENTYKNTARYTVGNTFIYVLDVYACILLSNTCIYMHILTYVLPITVSVYASMYWKYMHILLQTRQYTAHWKPYMCTYVHILLSMYSILYVSHSQYMIRTPTYVCSICMYI